MQNPLTFSKKIIKKTYHAALRSIAFYPVFISLALFLLAIGTLALENLDVIVDVKKENPYLFIEDDNTARTILSTLIAGILSLTVFSFTMVMVVLNQASSNFSPRLLPGLVSNKRHQLILGFYIGTLLYCTIVLISLGAYQLENGTVGTSTTIAAILGLVCVALFVSFIHNISSAIQIQNIVARIYRHTDKALETLLATELQKQTPLKVVADADFKEIVSKKTGYFEGFDSDLIDAELLKEDIQLVVLPYSGEHIWEGSPLLKISKRLTEEQEDALRFACTVSKDLHDGNHPLLGLIKLMEIAVRAMSPGINDPGTALDVVHKIGPLLGKMLRLPAYTSVNEIKRGMVVMKTNIAGQELLQTIIQPVRNYAKTDSTVMTGLLSSLTYLKTISGVSDSDTIAIDLELRAMLDDIKENITNDKDQRHILRVFKDADARTNNMALG
ncbi:DUF2254 domain-containing protein [Maribacter chungangensis]|uniref:DUF2254 domain-containing protein n=1 Tax=Maribacter chungangensis TaxID=1069117 RepID=A0ABW3B5A3_9FLAO